MSSVGAEPDRPPITVFLSYASEDRQAARRIGDALPAYGLEVWYDESELGGGDVWDQKIRKQIRDCDYFMALVSAQTEARHEGYFRREWRLAVERTLDMADDHPFLLPIVIDDTDQAGARVPEKFLTVQWLKVPGGEPTPALESAMPPTRLRRDRRCPVAKKARGPVPPRPAASAPALSYPEFPREEPGQRIRFWFGVAGWAIRSAVGIFRTTAPMGQDCHLRLDWHRPIVQRLRDATPPRCGSSAGNRAEAQGDFGPVSGQLEQGRHREAGYADCPRVLR